MSDAVDELADLTSILREFGPAPFAGREAVARRIQERGYRRVVIDDAMIERARKAIHAVSCGCEQTPTEWSLIDKEARAALTATLETGESHEQDDLGTQ